MDRSLTYRSCACVFVCKHLRFGVRAAYRQLVVFFWTILTVFPVTPRLIAQCSTMADRATKRILKQTLVMLFFQAIKNA